MLATRTRHAKKGESGIALLLALLVLVLVTAVTMGMIMMSNTETNIAANYSDELHAFDAARAGLEEARDRMRASAGSGVALTLPTALPGQTGGVLYITNPTGTERVQPWNAANAYADDEVCQEAPASCSSTTTPAMPIAPLWYSSVSAASAYAASPVMPYKWVRVNLKTNQAAYGSSQTNYVNGSNGSTSLTNVVCWNGVNEFLSSTGSCSSQSNPVYMVTALAVSQVGTRRMVQMEVTRDLGAKFPGAITFAGSGQTQCQVNGTAPSISGYDHAAGAPPNSGVAGIAASTTNAYNGCAPGVPPNQSVGAPPYNTSPSVQNMSATGTPLDPRLDPATGLNAYVATLEAQADQTFSDNIPDGANLGTATNPKITVVTNPTQLGGVTGYGVLLVCCLLNTLTNSEQERMLRHAPSRRTELASFRVRA